MAAILRLCNYTYFRAISLPSARAQYWNCKANMFLLNGLDSDFRAMHDTQLRLDLSGLLKFEGSISNYVLKYVYATEN
jgi:hypothetical protein